MLTVSQWMPCGDCGCHGHQNLISHIECFTSNANIIVVKQVPIFLLLLVSKCQLSDDTFRITMVLLWVEHGAIVYPCGIYLLFLKFPGMGMLVAVDGSDKPELFHSLLRCH